MLYHPSPHISLSLHFGQPEDEKDEASPPVKPIRELYQDEFRIPILQADEHFVCIDKPPFLRIDSKEDKLQTIAERGNWTAQSILRHHLCADALLQSQPMDGPLANITTLKQVHQLDANTSGIFLYAKHKLAASEAGHLFQDRQVKKTYLAILHGHVEIERLLEHAAPIHTPNSQSTEAAAFADTGMCMLRVDAHIQAVSAQRCSVVAAPERDSSQSSGKGHPQAASTLLRPLHAFSLGSADKPVTLVQLKPITGRRHQLRVHCAAIGHAIVGDWMYEPDPTLDSGRMFLHAFELRMKFPDLALLRGSNRRKKSGKLAMAAQREPAEYIWRTELPFSEVLGPYAIRRMQDLL